MNKAILNEDFEIRARFVPKARMRYDTLGDYQMDDDILGVVFTVDSSLDFKDRIGVLLHEIAEWAVAMHTGVPIASIDEWDFSHPDSPEPGGEPGCPYRIPHSAGMAVEEAFNASFECRDA